MEGEFYDIPLQYIKVWDANGTPLAYEDVIALKDDDEMVEKLKIEIDLDKASLEQYKIKPKSPTLN